MSSSTCLCSSLVLFTITPTTPTSSVIVYIVFLLVVFLLEKAKEI